MQLAGQSHRVLPPVQPSAATVCHPGV